jgi:hypothetical protein
MPDNNQDRESPTSWIATLVGVAFFLILGLDLILGEIPNEWGVPSWLAGLRSTLLLSSFVFPVIILGVGWVKGFPRWSYPYVGFVLLVSLYMMQVATPGLRILNYTFGRNDLWGWRSWIPFLVMAAIVLLITHSLRPLSKLFTNIWGDWTLLTFGMFGFTPLLIGIGFDEVDRLYSLRFMVALTLLTSGTALAYLRSTRWWQRVLVLLVGIILTVTIVTVAPAVYWSEHGWVNVQGTLMVGAIVVAVMLSPGLIGLLRRSAQLPQVG